MVSRISRGKAKKVKGFWMGTAGLPAAAVEAVEAFIVLIA
jgi:hypothetical protein